MTAAEARDELRHWQQLQRTLRLFELRSGKRLLFRKYVIEQMERLAKLVVAHP